ncbi:MAG: hypothetical protein ACRDPH_12735 [Marmoricola sp.]
MAALEVVRGGYGALQLVRPRLVAGRLLGRPDDRDASVVVRVLGVRHVVQAVVSGTRPTSPVLAVGAAVDLLHAASMLGVGLVGRDRRHAAFVDAGIAGGFGAAGLLASWASSPRHSD